VIFLTVGHQMPFDRLVRWANEWAGLHPGVRVVAQIGESDHKPRHVQSHAYLSPAEFGSYLEGAEAIVAHAGTGTILQALYIGKPLLVVPRLARLGETRNDHQVGTARHFASKGLLQMAEDQESFMTLLDKLPTFRPPSRVSGDASPELITALSEFIAR
jgi:UDP-N-acetylglucosamine transferase subunit ALG13